MPLTWEIVRNERNNLNEADYYLSKTFFIRLAGENNAKSRFKNGMYIVSEDNSPQTLKFTHSETKGKYFKISDVPRGGETLEISFPEKNIRLKFARNMSKNRFELDSAVINANNYALLIHDEPPYLTVKTISKALPPSSNRYDVIYIRGQGSLSKSVIVSYMRHRNPNAPPKIIESIIDAYFWAAGSERINPDIAIAQMCRATNFLSNERIMQTHNYADLLPTPEWPGRFSSMRQGVITHIQRLKGCTSNARPGDPAEPIHTLEDLSRKLAPNNPRGYENEIRDIIYDMRLFSK
jgi:hypothetical protein